MWHYIRQCRGASQLQADICLFKFKGLVVGRASWNFKASTAASHYEKQGIELGLGAQNTFKKRSGLLGSDSNEIR
jgi:hypothetical protein